MIKNWAILIHFFLVSISYLGLYLLCLKDAGSEIKFGMKNQTINFSVG